MRRPVVHIVGAGLAGLAAAVRLAKVGTSVIVHEAASHAGGRCRSYYEPALGITIDNGNHLLLSGNGAALSYLRAIKADEALVGPDRAEFLFADLATGERWSVRPNNGSLPWWILSAGRRVPGTGWMDYLALGRLLWAAPGTSIGGVMDCTGIVYERLWRPFLLAALNTEPEAASVNLAAVVVRETLAKGGRACRPLVAAEGLSSAFVDPAVRHLDALGALFRFRRRLRRLVFDDGRVAALDFGEETTTLGVGDAVVLAVPAWVAASLVPGLSAPTDFRAIVNAHFRISPPLDFPRMLGVVNGTAEWLFAFSNRLSVTISGADRLLDVDRDVLARKIWREVAILAGLRAELPPWQIVKERRATFAALPAEDAKRPPPDTAWRNLVLAGDWTATGLPSTIEGAIRSGNRAAELVRRMH